MLTVLCRLANTAYEALLQRRNLYKLYVAVVCTVYLYLMLVTFAS